MRPEKQNFRSAESLELDDGYAVAYVTSIRHLIGLSDVNNPDGLTLHFNVDAARNLRDWLNQVLPTNE